MISVIIPVYNGEKYIEQSVLSVINQKDVDLEIIVVNDGSTDSTRNILKNIWDKYCPNGIIIDIENGGLANARNEGIKSCKGEYICNLDADDYFEPEILGKVKKIIEKEKCDICYYGFEDVDENGKILSNYNNSFQFIDNLTGNQAAKYKLLRKIWICQGSAVYRKSLITSYDLYNIKGIDQGEDLYFITAMLFVSKKVSCIRENGVYIRMLNSSMMHASYNDTFLQNKTAVVILKNKIISLMKNSRDEDLLSIIDVQLMDQICCIAKKMIRSNVFSFPELINRLNSLYGNEFSNLKKLKSYIKNVKYFEYNVFRTSRIIYILFVKMHG